MLVDAVETCISAQITATDGLMCANNEIIDGFVRQVVGLFYEVNPEYFDVNSVPMELAAVGWELELRVYFLLDLIIEYLRSWVPDFPLNYDARAVYRYGSVVLFRIEGNRDAAFYPPTLRQLPPADCPY